MTDNLELLEQATESPGKSPIVGMGASAGGLEAFEQFFRHVQPDSNLGFVIISHLDPSHASILTEILQRSSNMPVIEAVDQMQVQPDPVYVIPPNRDRAIFHGVLQLSVPEQPRGQRMPIDASYLAHRQPYQTLEDNVIDGVVLTFTDISSRVAAEVAVRKAKDLAEGVVCTVRKPLIVLDEQLWVIRAGNAFYQYVCAIRQDTEGRLIYQSGDSQWDIPALCELLGNRLPQNPFFDGFLVERDFPLIGHKKLLLNGCRIVDDGDSLIFLVIEESS